MSIQLRDKIISNKYKGEKYFLNKINEFEILPYLPDVIIEYILQFLVTITDYMDHYIELDYDKLNNHKLFYIEMFPYILQLHNNPKKEEICKNWDYGEEFLLISNRHENGNAFYSLCNDWQGSFISDLQIQIKCISKSRSSLSKKVKELLKYIMPINKILRINYRCDIDGCANEWEKDLGPHFQNIINLSITEQNEILSIWGYECEKCFTQTMKYHVNNKKNYLVNNANISWMCSCVTGFMMNKYH